MDKMNLVEEMRSNDRKALNSIIDLMVKANIKELDISNPNDEYDDVYAYCFDENGITATNIKLNKIVLDGNTLVFIDEENLSHWYLDFHDGSMPYIYNAVYDLIGDIVLEQKTYNVYIHYHGCYTQTVTAVNREEALEKVRNEVNSLSDLEFLDAIGLAENGYDIYENKTGILNKN